MPGLEKATASNGRRLSRAWARGNIPRIKEQSPMPLLLSQQIRRVKLQEFNHGGVKQRSKPPMRHREIDSWRGEFLKMRIKYVMPCFIGKNHHIVSFLGLPHPTPFPAADRLPVTT
jgi:hypothetical protein